MSNVGPRGPIASPTAARPIQVPSYSITMNGQQNSDPEWEGRLEAKLHPLAPMQADIIVARLGLNGTPVEPIRDLEKRLHLTHDEVRRQEARALMIIRQGHAED
jgi:DNA-directed RNA polymerase sigma subunit (sigma70/sigma32)